LDYCKFWALLLCWHSIHHHDETERRKWQNPEAILYEIGLKPGQAFVDIGCNDGFFAIPEARMVDSSGKVYGLDADLEVIRCFEGRHHTDLN
jgi:ubiquinone/menaquinone biosynthesis C-methylase UbiE